MRVGTVTEYPYKGLINTGYVPYTAGRLRALCVMGLPAQPAPNPLTAAIRQLRTMSARIRGSNDFFD